MAKRKVISHIFYHQEAVEEDCAVNSWRSVVPAFRPEDEVVVLDVGNTLNAPLPMDFYPKCFRVEKLRTDIPEERSYTYGLNRTVPTLAGDWIVLWRSDYIYQQNFGDVLRDGMLQGNAVLPYECFIGAYYCDGPWCESHFAELTKGPEEFLLEHCTVSAVHESSDYAHFALKKDLWLQVGGMDQRLWGYGWQFPEIFWKLRHLPAFKPVIRYDLLAFHQTHGGSFGNKEPDESKKQEERDGKNKLIDLYGSREAAEQMIANFRQAPLRPRRPDSCYQLKRG